MKTTNISRKDFLSGALASLGLGFLGGRSLFAVPPGWTPPSGTPDLVFGVISDSHLGIWAKTNNATLERAFKYFKKCGVHAVMHCGDISNNGIYGSKLNSSGEPCFPSNASEPNEDLRLDPMYNVQKYWNNVFSNSGQQPVKLFVTGNHDYYGGSRPDSGLNYSSPTDGRVGVEAWVSDVLDPGYCDVWHKKVAGTSGKLYHFFGYGGPEGATNQNANGAQMAQKIADARLESDWDNNAPFFLMSHIPPSGSINSFVAQALGLNNPDGGSPAVCNKGLWLYGHGHQCSSAWGSSIQFPEDACMPRVQCGLMGCKTPSGEKDSPLFAQGFGDGTATGWSLPSSGDSLNHGYVVSVYAEAIVIHRVDLRAALADNELASLGPDWVMSLEDTTRAEHPLSRASMKAAILSPEFQNGAELELSWGKDSVEMSIPKADGNAASRIYGFNVEVIGTGAPIRKSVYASGYNRGLGFEPNGGVTTLSFAKSELPGGDALTFRVYPCSSLGTRGKPLCVTQKVIRVSLDKSVPNVGHDARFALTNGAKLADDAKIVAECPPWVKRVCVEDGEIVAYTRPIGATVNVK